VAGANSALQRNAHVPAASGVHQRRSATNKATAVQLLIDNPLLTLMIVAALGYAIGQIRVAGSSLGAAAVLFVGLAFGALDPRLRLPDPFYLLGLALFVYTVGLSSGHAFFSGLRRQGLRYSALCVAVLLLAALMLFKLRELLGLSPALTVGIFAGAFTNTPALAAVLDVIRTTAPAATREQLLAEPVVAYSATYLIGVIGPMLAMFILPRLWKVDYAREGEQLRARGIIGDQLSQRTIRITRDDLSRRPLASLAGAHRWDVVFGRMKRGQELALASGDTCLAPGDLVAVVGTAPNLELVTKALGEPSDERLDTDRRELDFRRIFVSNPEAAGKRLADLRLPERFHALVTRIRRGDTEILPHGDTILELGDRVRVVTSPRNMGAISAFFGDSYRALSEVNMLSLCLGLAMGLLLGLVPIPLPGGITLSLGYAGGPLVMALILGARERTGPLVWSLPYSANLTLRQLGLILFLAGIGTRAGSMLITTFAEGGGLVLVLAGALVTCGAILVALWVGYQLLHIPMSLLLGIVAGMQTHPALLSFAGEQTGNDGPLLGYTAVYPVAIIAKIIIVQLLLLWMG
jgi:putative transport protein